MRRLIAQVGLFRRGAHDLGKHSGGVIKNHRGASIVFFLGPAMKELHAAAGGCGVVHGGVGKRPARQGPGHVGSLKAGQGLGIGFEVTRARLAGEVVGIGHAQDLAGFR